VRGLAVRNAEALLAECERRDAHSSVLLATDAVHQQVEHAFLCKPCGAGVAVLARRQRRTPAAGDAAAVEATVGFVE